MVDIASLGFSIDTSDVAKAETALDGLNATGARTEAAAKGVGEAWSGASKQAASSAGEFRKGSDALREQQQELAQLIGKIDPVVGALGRLDEQEAKLRQFRGQGLLDTESFGEYQAKIDQARRSLSDVDGAISRTGNTSKQTAQALRQLPAQFSDIFISLQAGQSPLTVFLQQGAQIKDSFGGVGPALAETARYALGLVNPFTVAAVAVGALALAYKQGSDEGTAFNNALILSGNIAGTSAERLANAAAAIDQVTGTQRQAARALAEVAGTGKFTADQIETIGLAAVAMEEATGRAISETVNEFKRLADEPAAAAAKLNEQYNFLTAAVFDQISALEQQGDAAGAAQLAIDTFAQTMNDRANEINNGLGYIERAWKGIKSAAAEAWDEMLGVGRPDTPEDRLDRLTSGGIDFGAVGGSALLAGPFGAAANFGKQLYDSVTQSSAERNEQISEVWQEIQDRDEKAWVEGMQAQQEQSAIEAQQRIDQLRKSTLTNAEKRVKALNDLRADLAKIELVNPDDPRLAADNVAWLERNIAEQFRDRQSTTRTPAVRDDAATKLLLSLRQQSAELETQLLSEAKLTAEQKKRAEFESLIADLKTKDILTADQKSLLASQDAIKAQLDKNVALGEEVRLHNDSIKLQERSAQLQETIRASLEGRQEQQQRQLDAFGLGRRELERVQAEASIFREFRRYQAQLDKATPSDLLGSEQYNEAVREIERGLQKSLENHEKYYDRLREEEADWSNGARSSLIDYLDEAANVSGQTYDLFSNALFGLEDAFVEFALTGKASVRDLVDSFLADVARMGARQLTANLAEGLLGFIPGADESANLTAGAAAVSASAAALTTAGGTLVTGAAAIQAAAASLAAANAGSSVSGGSGGLLSLFGSSGGYTGAYGFDGGGWTGGAPRSGGLDGKGGFLAILHPQETVIDHTKPSRSQFSGPPGNNVVINADFSGMRTAGEAREATATLARQVNSAVSQASRYN
ncbi:phage tail tape measure protein [Pseudomonas sp. PL-6]